MSQHVCIFPSSSGIAQMGTLFFFSLGSGSLLGMAGDHGLLLYIFSSVPDTLHALGFRPKQAPSFLSSFIESESPRDTFAFALSLCWVRHVSPRSATSKREIGHVHGVYVVQLVVMRAD